MNKTIIGGMLMLALVGCSKPKEEQAETIRPVKSTQVTSLSNYTQEFSGVIQSDRFANLAFRVSGQLVKLDVDFGQKVKKGQLIAQLDPRDFNLQVEVTGSSYETSKAQLERSQRLYERQTISKQELEIAQNQYNAAKVNYENAKNSLADTRLYAPYAGSIEKRIASNYQRVQAGEAIVKLVDPNDLFVWFTISDNALFNARGKFNYKVEIASLPGLIFNCDIKEILDVSPDGTGIPVLLKISDPAFAKYKPNVKPGFTCKVILQVSGLESTGSCLVPLVSIFKDGDKQDAVWIIDQKSMTVHRRSVVRGSLTGSDQVFVLEGLKDGDQIVTAGVYQLKEGQKVKIDNSNAL